MIRQSLFALFLLLILLVSHGTAATTTANVGHVECEILVPPPRPEHGSIVIDSTSSLLLPDEIEGHGIRSGDGSPSDPYVISDWSLGEGVSIAISDRNEHFVIEEVSLSEGSLGIHLSDLRNLVIENVSVVSHSASLSARDVEELRIHLSAMSLDNIAVIDAVIFTMDATQIQFLRGNTEGPATMDLEGTKVARLTHSSLCTLGDDETIGFRGQSVQELTLTNVDLSSNREILLGGEDATVEFQDSDLRLLDDDAGFRPVIRFQRAELKMNGTKIIGNGFHVESPNDLKMEIERSSFTGSGTGTAVYIASPRQADQSVELKLEKTTFQSYRSGVAIGTGAYLSEDDWYLSSAPDPSRASFDIHYAGFKDVDWTVVNLLSNVEVDARYTDFGVTTVREAKETTYGDVLVEPIRVDGETVESPTPAAILVLVALALTAGAGRCISRWRSEPSRR